MCATSCELRWLSFFLKSLKIPTEAPATLFCDNKVGIAIANNPVVHERTKHIEIDCHIVRNFIQEVFLQIQSIPTKKQLADLFIMGLPSCHILHALQ